MKMTPLLICLNFVMTQVLNIFFMISPIYSSEKSGFLSVDQIAMRARGAVVSALEDEDSDSIGQKFHLIYQNFSQLLTKRFIRDEGVYSSFRVRQFIESQWHWVMSGDPLPDVTENFIQSGFYQDSGFPDALKIPTLPDTKRYVFIEYGGLIYPVSAWGRMKPLSDHPLDIWFKFLEQVEVTDQLQVGGILTLLFEDLFDHSKVFSESTLVVSRSKLKSLMHNYHESIFERFLKNEFFEEAELWLSLCQKYSVCFIKSAKEELTEVILPVTCPLLETILFWLKIGQNAMIEKIYDPSTKRWIDKDILKLMISEILGDNPFSEAQILRSEEIYRGLKSDSEDTKSRFLKNYCKTGKIRNTLLQILGQNELKLLLKNHSATRLFEFFRYVNAPGEVMGQLKVYQGYETLFGLNQNLQENLLLTALKEKKPSFIEFFYFVIENPDYHFTADNGENMLHLLLKSHEMEEGFLSEKDEARIVRILRFFFYSNRFSKDLAEEMLKSRNSYDETPFRFAAKMGLYRCYSVMSQFLRERGRLHFDEHRIGLEDDLEKLFLHGLLNRSGHSDDQHLNRQRSKIKQMIQNYRNFPTLFDAPMDIQNRYKRIVEKVSNNLNSEPTPEKYSKVIRFVFDQFHKSDLFSLFFKSSLNTRMSYLEPVLQLILTDARKSGFVDLFGDATVLTDQILGDEKYYVSEGLFEGIKNFFKNQVFPPKSEEPYSLGEDQLQFIISQYQK